MSPLRRGTAWCVELYRFIDRIGIESMPPLWYRPFSTLPTVIRTAAIAENRPLWPQFAMSWIMSLSANDKPRFCSTNHHVISDQMI